jgi:hypothetical protein
MHLKRGQSHTRLVASYMLTKILVFLVQSGLAVSCTVMYILLPATGQGPRAGGGEIKSVIHTTADSSVELQKST